MRFFKILSMFFLFISCLSCHGNHNSTINLHYDKDTKTLFVTNFESGRYVREVKIDLLGNTLSLHIKRRLLIGSKSIRKVAFNKIKIRLCTNIEFIEIGNKKIPITEIHKPNNELIESYYPSIEVRGDKFPFTIN